MHGGRSEVLAENASAFSAERDDVFSRIADRYDLLCDIFSLGIHRRWKSCMARRVCAHSGQVVLDVASGTGDIPFRVLRFEQIPRTLWVTDTCPKMLSIAKGKLSEADDRVRFATADAENLQAFDDASVDVYSISFAMKICNRERVIREAFRVLKPGGKFYCLEAARIPNRAAHAGYLAYMNLCMPLVGRLATNGDRSAYDYLLRGIHGFPDQETFAAELREVGFVSVSFNNLTFGIVALHEATKPAEARGHP